MGVIRLCLRGERFRQVGTDVRPSEQQLHGIVRVASRLRLRVGSDIVEVRPLMPPTLLNQYGAMSRQLVLNEQRGGNNIG